MTDSYLLAICVIEYLETKKICKDKFYWDEDHLLSLAYKVQQQEEVCEWNL